MQLTNDFSVPVGVDHAWEILNDVERIAPCLPGAQLQEIAGDEYRGVIKVKVGPITAQYKGAAVITERDKQARRIKIVAEGRDTRGQGSASATITVTMSDQGGSTDVQVHSDVTIKGKVAQFGRGMLQDVSTKILNSFVDSLSGLLAADSVSQVDSGASTSRPRVVGAPSPHQVDVAAPEPISLAATAGWAVGKRLLPVGVAVLLVLTLLRTSRRRARSAS